MMTIMIILTINLRKNKSVNLDNLRNTLSLNALCSFESCIEIKLQLIFSSQFLAVPQKAL